MKISLLRSLRFRMPLVVLTGIIPLILIAIFYASDRGTKQISQEARENMALKADLLAESVNRWNQLNALAVTNLSKQPDIVSMDRDKQELILTRTINTYNHFYLAMIIGLDGWNVARSDERKTVYFGDRDWFLGAKAGNDLTYETLIGRTTRRLALCLSVPIRNESIKILGVTVTCTDLEDIVKQVGELKFGNTGYAFIVNQDGTLLAHPKGELISGPELLDFSDYAPVKNMGNKGNRQYSFIDDRGVSMVSYYSPLKNGWGLVAVQEESEFLKNERDFENLVFLIAAVAVLGVSIITYLLANRLINPIANLTYAALGLSKGQLDRRVRVEREDELGILANSFNQMASQLKKLFSDQEKRIEERNFQLKEIQKAKEVAETANKSKDRFLANISHELRTPLNSILGYTKIILSDKKLAPDRVEELKIVEQSGNHLLVLINDILDFSKTQANKIQMHPSDLQLSKFLGELVDIVRMWAKEKDLEIETEWNNLPTAIQIDETRLRQILINLLSNAIKFTNKGSIALKVKVQDKLKHSGSLSQQKIRFEVIDTGVGISPEELKKIFKPFEQVGDIKTRAAGTGLGLSISRELVKLMGGELKVKSTLGSGSIFWFDITVPVVEISKPVPPKRTSKISGYKGKKRKILIVDDRQENRLLLVKMLQPKGFEVATANNGHEMLKSAFSFKPDLILMDLFMPEKTGFTAAKEIRRIPELKDIPIIVVTASSITKETGKYLEAEAILHKPIEERKLMANLQEYLQLEWTYQETVDRAV